MNLNYRVFRRNGKNLILLWSQSPLSQEQREIVSAFLVEEGVEQDRPISYSKFVPDNPEKFAADVAGIVINHSSNKMDPSKPCTIKVVFGDGEDSMEVIKEVLPANSVMDPARIPTEGSKRMYMYAFDYQSQRWVPWPSTGSIPSNIQIRITDSTGGEE